MVNMRHAPLPVFRASSSPSLQSLVILSSLTLCSASLLATPSPPPEGATQAQSPAEAGATTSDKAVEQGSTSSLPEVPPPVATLNCGPTPVKVGLPTLCELTVTHSASVSIKVTLPAGVEEGAMSPPQTLADGQLQSRRAFTLRHLELDKPLRVKGVKVTWDHAQGQSGVVELPAQRLEVAPSISSVLDPKVRSFQAPLPKPDPTPEGQARAKEQFWAQHGPPPLIELNWPLILTLGGLLISALGVGLGWLIRRWVEAVRRARQPKVDTRPAHVIALEAYHALVARRLHEEGQTKQLYHELSELIRDYLGRRFGLSGVEMTSDEVRAAARSAQVTGEPSLLIDQFLTDSDLVKFADASASQKAVEDILELALQVINATRAPDEEPEEGGQETAGPTPEEVSAVPEDSETVAQTLTSGQEEGV